MVNSTRSERMKVNIQGISKAVKDLQKVQKTTSDKLRDQIRVSTINVERNAKKRVPVDNGILRSSLRTRFGKLDADVYTELFYAPFVEFGTGTKVFQDPEGFTFSQEMKDYASQFRRGAGRNVQARPFLFPSWEEERPKFIEAVKKII